MNFASQLTAVSAVPRRWDKSAPGPPSVHTQCPQTHTHTLFPVGAAQGIKGQKGQRRREVRETQARVWCGQTQSAPAWLLECRDRKLGLVPSGSRLSSSGAFCSGPTQILPWTLSLPVPLPPPGDWDLEPPSADPIPPLSSAPSSRDHGHSYLPVPQFPHLCLPLFAQGPPEPGPTSWVLRIHPMAAWDGAEHCRHKGREAGRLT